MGKTIGAIYTGQPEQDPFQSRKLGQTTVDTSINMRLARFRPEDGQSKKAEARAPPGQVSHSPGEQPGRNEVAQRMYQSLSNNRMTAQAPSRTPGSDDIRKQIGTTGSTLDGPSSSHTLDDRPKKEDMGPYPELFRAMQQMNQVSCPHRVRTSPSVALS